jgi:hypothetical protein
MMIQLMFEFDFPTIFSGKSSKFKLNLEFAHWSYCFAHMLNFLFVEKSINYQLMANEMPLINTIQHLKDY